MSHPFNALPVKQRKPVFLALLLVTLLFMCAAQIRFDIFRYPLCLLWFHCLAGSETGRLAGLGFGQGVATGLPATFIPAVRI